MKEETIFVQRVIRNFLFYGRAVDAAMLTALSDIAPKKAAPTEDTLERTHQVLNYSATHKERILTYNASYMLLTVHSDTSYLSKPNKMSRAGGHLFLSGDTKNLTNNGAVLNISHIIKAVMALGAESELGLLFIKSRETVPQQKTL